MHGEQSGWSLIDGVSEVVDEGGDAGGAEAVVDVDHGDVGRTGVQHSEERGHAAKRCAIAHTGGYGEHRGVDETANDGGQSAFHAGADNEHSGGLKALLLGEKAVNTCDAYVRDEFDGVAHEACGYRSFFGHSQIAGACTDDGDRSLAWNGGCLGEGDGAGGFMKLGARLGGNHSV